MNLPPFILLSILSILSLSAGAPSRREFLSIASMIKPTPPEYFSSVSSDSSSNEEVRGDVWLPSRKIHSLTRKQAEEKKWKELKYHPDLSLENMRLLESESEWKETFCKHAKVIENAFEHLTRQKHREFTPPPPFDNTTEQDILVVHGAASKLYSTSNWIGRWKTHFQIGYYAYRALAKTHSPSEAQYIGWIADLTEAHIDLQHRMEKYCYRHKHSPIMSSRKAKEKVVG
ncbi:hypothetical protein BJ684DRAFT_17352 [Piptocephalis cylindrospora]|uniref:Uncharacterized protein n=1 Tax=Piptocephalis cylindrospora TaxID=1907219 RepID=A0A4P9Y0W1_9FUNG|nr:hypothetical protein BJ684DRAFT_17352 [Piptocephalis cylindrospora]|eukprot:RKP12132.1 hypothetical protein BJ684DRAFT_17352 [Piptocephalis cylindrospora]